MREERDQNLVHPKDDSAKFFLFPNTNHEICHAHAMLLSYNESKSADNGNF
jgi:hypothetical protein